MRRVAGRGRDDAEVVEEKGEEAEDETKGEKGEEGKLIDEAGEGETKGGGRKTCEAKGGGAMGEQGVAGEREVYGR